MSKIRHLGTAMAMAAAMLLVFSSVALGHRGPHFGPRGFDSVFIGTAEADTYPGDSHDNSGRNKIIGKAGDDVLDGGDRRDKIVGNVGNDILAGGAGSDRILGGRGHDRIDGGAQRDRILGGPGDDDINPGNGRDVVRAGAGDDLIIANDGRRDWIRCGSGEDTVTADSRDRVADNCESITVIDPEPDPEP